MIENWEMCSGVASICWEEGQSWKLRHGALTVDFRAGYSSGLMTISFVTIAVLIERDADDVQWFNVHLKADWKPA